MSKKTVKKCPKCRGKMVEEEIEVETSETGVLYWRIHGTEPISYICKKCGYIELYDRGRIKHVRKRRKKLKKKKQPSALRYPAVL